MNEGITQCSHGEERSGKTQTNFLAIRKQILSFPLVSKKKKPSHALGGKHCQPTEGRQVWRWDIQGALANIICKGATTT